MMRENILKIFLFFGIKFVLLERIYTNKKLKKMETLIKPFVKNLTNKKLTNKKVNVKKQPKERILDMQKGFW